MRMYDYFFHLNIFKKKKKKSFVKQFKKYKLRKNF